MGLDWMLLGPAVPNRQAEREALFRALMKQQRGPKPEGAAAIAQQLADLCLEVGPLSGAPRVGHDVEADAWAREHLGAAAVTKYQGRYVPDLAPADARAAYPATASDSPLDFRGAIVFSTLREADRELAEDCRFSCDEHAAARFATELEAAARHRRGDDARVLDAAVRWLRFWAARGCGFHAWE